MYSTTRRSMGVESAFILQARQLDDIDSRALHRALDLVALVKTNLIDLHGRVPIPRRFPPRKRAHYVRDISLPSVCWAESLEFLNYDLPPAETDSSTGHWPVIES